MKTTSSNLEVVEHSSVIIIAVKPNIVPAVLQEVAPSVTKDKLFISIAAGITTKIIESVSRD